MRPDRRPLGLRTPLIPALLALVTLTVSGLGVGSAPTIAPALRVHAPFPGTLVSPSENTYTTGCAGAHIVRRAQWVASTGIGVFSDRANGSGCSLPYGNQAGLVEGMATSSFWISIALPHLNGLRLVIVHWRIHVHGTVNLTVGKCAPSNASNYNCFQQAYWGVSGGAYLADTTTGALTYNTSWSGISETTLNDTTCSYGTCTSYQYNALRYGTNGPVAFGISNNFNASHNYTIVTFLSGEALAYLAPSYTVITGGSATATLNMDSIVNQAVLKDVTIV